MPLQAGASPAGAPADGAAPSGDPAAGAAPAVARPKPKPPSVLRQSPAASQAAVRRAVWDCPDSFKTAGGLSKEDLTKSKQGKVVSKRTSQNSKADYAGSKLQRWNHAVKRARLVMNNGAAPDHFIPVGGKTAEGQQLLQTVYAIRRMEGW